MRTLKLMICYAGKDKATALAIAKELNGKVFPDLDVTIEVIHMDDRDKGCINEWDKWSMNTVHESDIIMQLWTPSLLQYTEEGEPYCDKVLLEELGNARELGKQIIILDALGKNKYTRSMESFSRITKDPFPYFNDISQNEIAGIVTAVHRRAYEICHKQQPDYRVPPTTIGSLDSMGTLGDRFVGRKLDLDKIEEIFREGKKVVILHGDGGIGKTELMRKYVYDHKTEDYYCYKVCGDSHDLSLARELLSLQYKQELTDAQKRLGEYEQFCIRLETLKQLDPRFFLVIDNFNANFDTPENKRVLNKLIESIPFKLIISSRNDSRNAAVGTWHVGSLTPEEQKVLFYNESDLPRTAENDRKIEELSRHIDGHTMTLELCARLVKKRGYPLEKIIQELLHVSGKVECEHTGEKKEIGEHLIRLFELAELSESQKSLLYALSFFCRLGVSYADLEEVADQGDIEDDLDDLVEMSLVKQQKDGNYYLHPLVATLANDVYREGRDELSSRVSGFIFSEYDVDPQNDSQSKLLVKRSYLSHLLPLTPVDAMREDRIIILQTLGKLAELLDDDSEAINYYRQGLALAEKGQKESNEEDIRSRYCSLCRDLADLLWVRGETIEATELLLQQLQAQKNWRKTSIHRKTNECSLPY